MRFEYTRALLDAVPSIEAAYPGSPSTESTVILLARNLHKTFRGQRGLGSAGPKQKRWTMYRLIFGAEKH